MAIRRMTLAEAKANPPKVDRAKVLATTEADIARHMVEDGEDPVAEPKGRLVVPPVAVRTHLGLSQTGFAELLGIPVGTLRNWEQGRVQPDPAVRALLLILYREPEAAKRALQAA